jgi:hypothetical protein
MARVILSIPEGSPWWQIPDNLADTYTEELKKEIGPEHVLFQYLSELKVIAKCDANDDVLVAKIADANSFYLVHLTWSGKYDQMPSRFPSASLVQADDLIQFFLDYQ